jgi:hypothetical protein
MSDTNTLNWFDVDVDTMSPALKSDWAKLKKAQEQAKLAKDEFEANFTKQAIKAERIDSDVSLAFGYRFGKLAVAKVTAESKRITKPAKPKFTF